jgi:hypothetical protein
VTRVSTPESFVRRLPDTNETFFMIFAGGLDPFSEHAWQVVTGNCAGAGTPLSNVNAVTGYPLLEADADGKAFLAVTLPGTIDVTNTTAFFTLRVYEDSSNLSLSIDCTEMWDVPEHQPILSSHWW